MSNQIIHLVGFGSQGSAWADCLKKSGWQVQVYLPPDGPSFQKATNLGFDPIPLKQLPEYIADTTEKHWIAMLCPDPLIPSLYQQWIQTSPAQVRIILAHGYAVYSNELALKSPDHRAVLLAPKAIGPKLRQNFNEYFPHSHSLLAAFSAQKDDQAFLSQIAAGLGFHQNSLISATFAEETIGDLMSEQGLLCGGIFNLLEWTIESMSQAGIPDKLIREECLMELELIAGMIREKGPAETFQAISQLAQCGTIAMRHRLEASGFKKSFMDQMAIVRNQEFPLYFKSGEWKKDRLGLIERLSQWELQLNSRCPEIGILSSKSDEVSTQKHSSQQRLNKGAKDS